MRSVDERCSAVRGRSRRLWHRRDRRVAAAVAAFAIIAFVDLANRTIVGDGSMPLPSVNTLFGASSLYGPSAGGYALVALVAAVVAVSVTSFCMMYRKSSDAADEEAGNSTPDGESQGYSADDEDGGRP